MIGTTRVTGIVDKGPGRGALLYTERRVTDAASGELIATLASTSFARADGGFGGPAGPVKPVHSLPQRPPDAAVDRALSPRSALLYRLSGDYNPLHADPEFARSAGFPRPIAHGLLGFGVAAWAILQTACAGMPARLRMIDARFSAPFFPGETLRTEMWFDGPVISFRTLVVGREVTALNNGRAEIAPS